MTWLPAARRPSGSLCRAALFAALLLPLAAAPLAAQTAAPELLLSAPQDDWDEMFADPAAAPLADPCPPAPWLGRRLANPHGRHRGLGQPLVRTSWINRPISVGAFVGGLATDDLIEGRVEQTDVVFGGVRLGYDWNHYWGTELRYGYSEPDLFTADGLAIDGTAHNWFLDVSAQWYFWGDARWRPFVSLGAGLANFDYADEDGLAINETSFHLPVGGGVKYLFDRSLALRLDVTDNFAFGSDHTSAMHNFSYTLGVEWRFGGSSSRRYYPY